MVQKKNDLNLNHEEIRHILQRTNFPFSEHKPGWLERKADQNFIIEINEMKIMLQCSSKEIKYKLVNPWWVFWGPIIIYSLIKTVFSISPIYLAIMIGFIHLLYHLLDRNKTKEAIESMHEKIINAYKEDLQSNSTKEIS